MQWAALLPRYRAKIVTDDATVQALRQLAERATPDLRAVLFRLLGVVGIAGLWEYVRTLLDAHDTAGLETLLLQTWDTVGLQGLTANVAPLLQRLALAGATATALAEISAVFNAQDTEALAAIGSYVGRQITAISVTTREAVQGIVRRVLESELPLTQQIEEVVLAVGLTPVQAESLAAYRGALVDAGETGTQLLTLVDARAQALRLQRAEVIARTETRNAVHVGQNERLAQAIRGGVLDASRIRRMWILGPRPCPEICVPIPGMNINGVGMHEPFQTPVGPLLYPTAHPQCMCAVVVTVMS